MRKFYFFLIGIFLCIGNTLGVGRTQNVSPKKESQVVSTRQPNNSKNATVSRATTNRGQNTLRNDLNTEQTRKTVARTSINKTVSARSNNSAQKNTSRSGITSRRIARATTTTDTAKNELNMDYNACRDAYFTCMDQFCATQNETYRRCVCSSRLADIQAKERLLVQTADNLQDFHALNIDAISKTSDEIKSMVSASDGEQAKKQDISLSAKTLNNISDLLTTTKKKALSTSGTLDIAGNIKNIWTTTNLIGGTDIANLTGESLYNAVHTQCANIITENCNTSDLKMISATYGMYIENDCSVLADSLETRMTAANAAIRTTRHQMQDARLDNYNTHNALSVNDCVARVKQDIAAETACGENYVHCLDFSGKYLDVTTGTPIYSPDFYKLANQLSLSGNVINNDKNSDFIAQLEKKRIFATQSLDLCVDNADAVWDEFLHQAITEIYQQQQQRVKDVKSECLKVVNECYLAKSDTLKEFSDNSSLISLGHTLELSEDLCATKLNTCSNLYGGGPDGLSVLVNTMRNITNETIAQTCPELLTTFAQNICTVSVNDSVHSYPYGCRVYTPGEAMYARNAICNSTLVNPFSKSNILPGTPTPPDAYVCTTGDKRYTRCNFNYYLYNPYAIATQCGASETDYNPETQYCKSDATECRLCRPGYICTGGTEPPQNQDQTLYESCGIYYVGSLYQQLVRFALQNCTRPSDNSYTLSDSILADVDTVMRSVKKQLITELSAECDTYNGTWIDIPWVDDDMNGYHDTTGDTLLQEFYINTGTNKLWGYCK